MKTRNLLAILLIACMLAALFVACAKKEETPDSNPSQDVSTPSQDATVDPTDDGNEFEETHEINVWLPDLGNAGSATKLDMVNKAISDYCEETIGVKVNLTWLNVAEIGTQATLALTNNETIDVIGLSPVPNGSFLTYFSNGALKDISAELNEYGQGIIAALEPLNLLSAFTIDGGIYGMPTYRQLNTNTYIIMRGDVLDTIGMKEDFFKMTSWADYEAILAAIKASDLPMYGVGSGNRNIAGGGGFMFGSGSFTDAYSYDTLGDRNYIVHTNDDGTISMSFEQSGYVDACKMVADWMQKGYVYPDSAYNQDTNDVLIAQGAFAGAAWGSEYGVEAAKTAVFGTEAVALEIVSGMITTGNCQSWGAVVPVTAADPVGAVKFLNLIYTDSNLMNLLDWGIEDETYVINEDGYAAYPDGMDASTCGFHGQDFVFGNQFLVAPWVGVDGTDFRTKAEENMINAGSSRYLGLTVSTGDYGALVSALSNVYNEYNAQMVCGEYTDKLYDEYIEKLYSSGAEEYIAIYQTAIDNFLA